MSSDRIIVAKSNRGAPDPIGLHDSLGAIINPATNEKLDELKALLEAIDANTDGLEVTTDQISIDAGQINLNTDELENLSSSIDTKIGEVQATPTQYTLLGRLKDLYDELSSFFEDGTAKSKLWDGTNTAQINADGSINVAIPPTTVNKLVQGVYDKPHTAVNAYEWQDLVNYTIPAGYNLNAISFQALSETTGEKARAIRKKELASFDSPTDTFIDGESLTLPQFSARLYLKVTSAIGSNNDLVTITYTNHIGVTGRIATITIPKNSVVDTCLEVLLQSGDAGIIDITNITHSATGQAGAFQLDGITEIFFLVMESGNTLYQAPSPPLSSLVILEGEKIYIQYKSSTKSTYTRRVSFLGTLTETT